MLDAAARRVAEGRYAAARPLIDSALTIAPRSAEAYALRARVRMEQGQLREAWGDAEMAGRLGLPTAGEALTVLIDLRARDTVAARDRARRLAASLGSKTVLTEEEGTHLAVALAATGDEAGAAHALERMRRPVSPAVFRALQDPVFAGLRRSTRYPPLARSLGQPR